MRRCRSPAWPPAPGYYQVDATLQRDGVPVTGTKVLLTVAADGARLDFSTLPAGTDAGGPLPARGVAFADVLGTGVHRATMKWDVLLKNGVTAPLDTSVYETQYAAAAQQAAARGTTFIVQLGDGGAESRSSPTAPGRRGSVRSSRSTTRASLHYWEAWNEPNITYGSPPNYVNNVLKPGHRVVKSVDPSAKVLGSSTVGQPREWWWWLADAGGFAAHGHRRNPPLHRAPPFPARNTAPSRLLKRFMAPPDKGAQAKADLVDRARVVVQRSGEPVLPGRLQRPRAAALPPRVGHRAVVLLPRPGHLGQRDVTFSAIEAEGFVKPAALALMTTSAELKGRPYLGLVDVGHSSAYAMRFGPRAGGTDQLLVTWTDGVRLPAVLKGRDGTPLTKVDLLGHRTSATVNGALPLELGPSPVFLRTPVADALTVQLGETFGPDVALSSAGATVSASSSRPTNPASGAIDGDSTAAGRGDLPWMPAWGQAPGDTAPTLTVRLPRAQVLNRVLVSTHSNGSVVTSLRDYDVEVRNGDGAWQSVAQVRGQYHYRQQLVSFAPQTVTEIRVRSLLVNFSGYAGGAKPSWWPTDAARLSNAEASWYGPAVISELAAYAPGQVTSGTAPTTSPSPTVTPAPTAPPTVAPTTPPTVAPPAPTTSPSPVVTPSPVVSPTPKPTRIKGPKPRSVVSAVSLVTSSGKRRFNRYLPPRTS